MKIDPATGKAYRKDWKGTSIAFIRPDFSSGYVQFVGLATDEYFGQVDAINDEGSRAVRCQHWVKP